MDTDPDVTIQKAKRPISDVLNWGQRDRQAVCDWWRVSMGSVCVCALTTKHHKGPH